MTYWSYHPRGAERGRTWREPASLTDIVQNIREHASDNQHRRLWGQVSGMSWQEITGVVEGSRTTQQAYQKVLAWMREQEQSSGAVSPVSRTRLLARPVSTSQYRSMVRDLGDVKRAANGRLKCWEAAIDSFGVETRTGKGEHVDFINSQLIKAGYEVTLLDRELSAGTVSQFIALHRDDPGGYMIYTRGHAISLKDGVITDTQGLHGRPGAKRVESVYRVTVKPPLVSPPRDAQKPRPLVVTWPSGDCDGKCHDPAAWGHRYVCPSQLGRFRSGGAIPRR